LFYEKVTINLILIYSSKKLLKDLLHQKAIYFSPSRYSTQAARIIPKREVSATCASLLQGFEVYCQ
jgi:hypothetical protein